MTEEERQILRMTEAERKEVNLQIGGTGEI
jgi:hypothetical protein